MDTPTFPERILSRDGAVAVVTLNNPARLNPISRTVRASLRQVLALVAADNTVRALVLTGAGRASCSGADLSAMSLDDGSGRSLGNTLDQQLGYEVERQRELIDRPELTEGVWAFLGTRPPLFPPC